MFGKNDLIELIIDKMFKSFGMTEEMGQKLIIDLINTLNDIKLNFEDIKKEIENLKEERDERIRGNLRAITSIKRRNSTGEKNGDGNRSSEIKIKENRRSNSDKIQQ